MEIQVSELKLRSIKSGSSLNGLTHGTDHSDCNHGHVKKSDMDEEDKRLGIIRELQEVAPGNPQVLIILKKYQLDNGIKPNSSQVIKQQIVDDQKQKQGIINDKISELTELNKKLHEEN
jgi:hypothetical protein